MRSPETLGSGLRPPLPPAAGHSPSQVRKLSAQPPLADYKTEPGSFVLGYEAEAWICLRNQEPGRGHPPALPGPCPAMGQPGGLSPQHPHGLSQDSASGPPSRFQRGQASTEQTGPPVLLQPLHSHPKPSADEHPRRPCSWRFREAMPVCVRGSRAGDPSKLRFGGKEAKLSFKMTSLNSKALSPKPPRVGCSWYRSKCHLPPGVPKLSRDSADTQG